MRTIYSYIRSITNALVDYYPADHQIKVRYSSDVQFEEIKNALYDFGFTLAKVTPPLRTRDGICVKDALFV